jgi:predicted ferric reductase
VPLARRHRVGRTAALLALAAAAALALGPPLLLPRARPDDPLLYTLGQRAALLALGLLVLQLGLATRLRPVDLALGLGGAMRLHRAAGLAALGLLLLHPGLLLWATRGALPLEWRVALGAGALLVLLAGVLAALLFRRLRVDYLRWRALHRGMLAALLLGAVHARALGEHLRASRGAQAWWAALLAAGAAALAWRALVRPRWGRRRYRVASIAEEAQGTWTLSLAPEDGRPLAHLPGQFVFLTLLRAGLPAEEHPFTLSSAPGGEAVAVTIKASGDFTRTVDRTRPGDAAWVEGPFGRFSHLLHPAGRYVFIGAGAGATPFASMLRHLRDTADPRPALFLCVNRTEADIPFREELARLPAHVRVVHVLSQPGARWRGARGRLDAPLLRALAGPSLPGAAVFLCGPPGFMVEVRRALRSLGVARSRIHVERFSVP